MNQITHICPECGHNERLPVAEISHGDGGLWVCGGCDVAYQIQIRMQAVRRPNPLVTRASLLHRLSPDRN